MRRLIQNKAISYALIISLISSVLLPSLASAGESESRVLLCTSQGYQWVTVQAAQDFVLETEASDSDHCFYCLSSNGDPEHVFFRAYSFYLPLLEEVIKTERSLSLASDYQYPFSRTRAPPRFI